MLIGRKEELREIREAYKSEYSQFIAVLRNDAKVLLKH